MKNVELLDSLPDNFRHEKSFLSKNNIKNYEKIMLLKDSQLNEIIRSSSLCTLNNLKKIRAIAIFNIEIKISPPQAYLLLHCGIGSVKSLARLNPYELNQRIGRLERTLGTKTKIKITLNLLKNWINRANQIY